MTAKLGLPVVYHAHADHKGVHHPEQDHFHAYVTRVHKDGSVDLVFFPPGRDPKHAERVKEAEYADHGDHCWTMKNEDRTARDLWRNIDERLADLERTAAAIQSWAANPPGAASATAGSAGGAGAAGAAS